MLSLFKKFRSGAPSGVTLPQGVRLIAFTQMWESFSFFGMRALLVLYLVSEAGFSSADAFILYTLYIAFVKIFAAAGGLIVDRFLGYTRSVLVGGVLIAIGHLLLTFSSSSLFFYLSLGTIVCGSALFRVSLQALLGFFYSGKDSGRERGFTFYYVGMNIGGLLAAVLCGFVAQIWGWHAGFGLAACGMVIGMLLFISKIQLFKVVEKPKQGSSSLFFLCCLIAAGGIATLFSHFEIVRSFALPIGLVAFGTIMLRLYRKIDKGVILPILGSLLLLAAFSTAEELWGSLLMIFSENHIQRTLLGFEIPSAALAATNPLTIMLLGPFIARCRISSQLKLALSFLFLAAAFSIFSIASLMEGASLLYLIAGLASIAIGELLLNPTAWSFVSQSTPHSCAGTAMGATKVALSIGSLLSGEVAHLPFDPGITFMIIGSGAFALFLLLISLSLKKVSE